MKTTVRFSLLLLALSCGVFPLSAQTEQKADLYVETGHTLSVKSIAFSQDGKVFASASIDNTVKLWDVLTKRELKTLYCENDGISRGANSVSFSPDSKSVAA